MGREMTVALLVKGDRVLLGMKKRDWGEGLWNGFGGHIEPGETPEEAMIRECHEEVGVIPTDYWTAGWIKFVNQAKDGIKNNKVHLYVCTAWRGKPIDTEEMRPVWFDKDHLPYENMWDADGVWVPRVLAGESLNGSVVLDQNFKTISIKLTKA